MTEDKTIDYLERAWTDRQPIDYEIFKGKNPKFGVLKLELKKAYSDREKKKAQGVVRLSMTPTQEADKYDWDKRVMMYLGLPDISKIILFLSDPESFKDNTLSLSHDRSSFNNKDPHQDMTYLTLSKPENMDSVFVKISKRDDKKVVQEVTVPISPDEVVVVGTLLKASIPLVLAWE